MQAGADGRRDDRGTVITRQTRRPSACDGDVNNNILLSHHWRHLRSPLVAISCAQLQLFPTLEPTPTKCAVPHACG